eukprot:6832781-Pyramimonas_sp.AAC.1
MSEVYNPMYPTASRLKFQGALRNNASIAVLLTVPLCHCATHFHSSRSGLRHPPRPSWNLGKDKRLVGVYYNAV